MVIISLALLWAAGAARLCAQTPAPQASAASEVSLQLSPDGGLEIRAPAYWGRVGADGNLHSLRVGETEMLDDKTSFSLGAFFFSDEPERLGRVTLPAPATVQATDGIYNALYKFLPGEVRISLSHAAPKKATFYLVLSEEIVVVSNARDGTLAAVPAEERWPDVTFTATSGAFMTVRGGDRIWGPWAKRQMLEIGPLPAGETREISISFGQGPPPSPTPAQLLTLRAEALDNRQVLGFGRPAQLTVSVENRGAAIPDALLSASITQRQDKTVSEVAQQVSITAKGRTESRFDISLPEPGIYRASLKLSVDGRTLKEAQVPFAFMPEQIRSSPALPADFESFWEAAQIEARTPAQEPALFTEDPSFSSEAVRVWQVSFSGDDGSKLSGWLCAPGTAQRSPAILQLSGYGQPKISPPLVLAGRGYVALAVEVVPAATDTAYIARSLEDPRQYPYRGIVINTLRSLDILMTRPEVDPSRVAISGASQGGGLALIVAGLRPEIAAVAADVPMLCDFSRAVKDGGWPYSEIGHYLQDHPQSEIAAMRTLAYFDVLNFAPRLQSPVLLSLGLKDRICLPETIFAAHNLLPGNKEIKVYPEAGHEGGGSAHWLYKLQWLDSLLKPAPALPFAAIGLEGETGGEKPSSG